MLRNQIKLLGVLVLVLLLVGCKDKSVSKTLNTENSTLPVPTSTKIEVPIPTASPLQEKEKIGQQISLYNPVTKTEKILYEFGRGFSYYLPVLSPDKNLLSLNQYPINMNIDSQWSRIIFNFNNLQSKEFFTQSGEGDGVNKSFWLDNGRVIIPFYNEIIDIDIDSKAEKRFELPANKGYKGITVDNNRLAALYVTKDNSNSEQGEPLTLNIYEDNLKKLNSLPTEIIGTFNNNMQAIGYTEGEFFGDNLVLGSYNKTTGYLDLIWVDSKSGKKVLSNSNAKEPSVSPDKKIVAAQASDNKYTLKFFGTMGEEVWKVDLKDKLKGNGLFIQQYYWSKDSDKIYITCSFIENDVITNRMDLLVLDVKKRTVEQMTLPRYVQFLGVDFDGNAVFLDFYDY